MKKLLAFVLFLPVLAFGQATTAYHRLNQVLSRAPQGGVNAQVVPYATIAVTNSATHIAGAIYQDPGLTIAYPGGIVTADANGNYGYYFALQLCMTEKISSPSLGGPIPLVNICSNTTAGGSVSSVAAGTLPSWLGLTVANPTGAVVLNFTASPIPDSALATQAANTVLGALTSTTPSPLTIPDCHGALNALLWTAGTGFSCNTISAGSGTVTTTGSPANGNLAVFSGATSISNGDLSGDATTSGTLAVTVVKVNGGSLPVSALALATNGGGQIVASTLQGLGTKLLTAGTVSGTGALFCTDATGGATTSGCPTPLANPMTTPGDIIRAGSVGTPTRLGIGSTGQQLFVSGGIPAWGGTPRTSGTNGSFRIDTDGTITEYVNTGALNNNTPTTITLPASIPTAVDSIVCSDNGGRVQSGNDQPVGANVVGLSAPFSTFFANTPATGVTAYCVVIGH